MRFRNLSVVFVGNLGGMTQPIGTDVAAKPIALRQKKSVFRPLALPRRLPALETVSKQLPQIVK